MSTCAVNKKSSNGCTEGSWVNQSHQNNSNRKQKFNKNSKHSKNQQQNYPKVVARDENNNEILINAEQPNALVPGEASPCAYVPDQSITECQIQTEEIATGSSEGYSPSSDSNASSEQPQQNVYDQGIHNFSPCENGINDSNCYNAAFEYDYQHTNVQQQSQYYIYQPYHDYSTVPNIAGSPLNNSFTGTPQQQQQQYYTAYQPIPSYIYDPQNCSYTSAYSPVQQQNPHQTFHQTPGNTGQTNLSSPQQQQSTFLASYQTPPQPGHQLYIQTSNITPPTSLSPNDTPTTNSSATDRASDCNSPHPNQNGVVPGHLTQTPVHNSYVMHNPELTSQYTPQPPVYTPLTPQQYQCNSPMPTQQFMIYNPPLMSQGSPYQTGQNSPMVQTPYSCNNSSSFKSKNSRSNRFNKRNFNQKYNYADQTPQSTYSLEENQYQNSPVSAPTFEQNLEFESSPENQMPIYPTSSYCDPNMGMPNTEAILNAAYNYDGGIDSYGDDYSDQYGDDNNGDNDENLACQVCRGRRMCFCYFLKVRYYKFPSFFDLVDHQYKKWRKTMAANGQQIPQPPFMNGQQMLNQSQSMNTSIMQSPNINGNIMMQQSPHSMSNIPKNKA